MSKINIIINRCYINLSKLHHKLSFFVLCILWGILFTSIILIPLALLFPMVFLDTAIYIAIAGVIGFIICNRKAISTRSSCIANIVDLEIVDAGYLVEKVNNMIGKDIISKKEQRIRGLCSSLGVDFNYMFYGEPSTKDTEEHDDFIDISNTSIETTFKSKPIQDKFTLNYYIKVQRQLARIKPIKNSNRSQLLKVIKGLLHTNNMEIEDNSTLDPEEEKALVYTLHKAFIKIGFIGESEKLKNLKIAKKYITNPQYEVKFKSTSKNQSYFINNQDDIISFIKPSSNSAITLEWEQYQEEITLVISYFKNEGQKIKRKVTTLGDYLSRKQIAEWFTDPANIMPAIIGTEFYDNTVIKEDGTNYPHHMIMGGTGGGKSWFISMKLSTWAAFNTPNELCYVILDPKNSITLKSLKDLPHTTLYSEDVSKYGGYLKCIVQEGDRRKKLLSSSGAEDIKQYNIIHLKEKLPYIYVVIDELISISERLENYQEEILKHFSLITAEFRFVGIGAIFIGQRVIGKGDKVLPKTIRAQCESKTAFRPTKGDIEYIFDIAIRQSVPKEPGVAVYSEDGVDLKIVSTPVLISANTEEKLSNEICTWAIGEAHRRLGYSKPYQIQGLNSDCNPINTIVLEPKNEDLSEQEFHTLKVYLEHKGKATTDELIDKFSRTKISDLEKAGEIYRDEEDYYRIRQ